MAGRWTRFCGPKTKSSLGKRLSSDSPFLLRDAAADADDEPGLDALAREQDAELRVQPVLGLLADRAGVDQDHVRVIGPVTRLETRVVQQVRHLLGIVLVHLAPEGPDVEPAPGLDLKRYSRGSVGEEYPPQAKT